MLAASLLLGFIGPPAAFAETPKAAATEPQSFVRATRMIGREIVDNSGEVFGEVEEYVVDDKGQAFAVVAIGGFLGLAENEVLVPHVSISLSPDVPELLVFLGTAAELATAPAFRPERDALRITAKERKLLLTVRAESKDVNEAQRTLQAARARLNKEREELLAAEAAKRRTIAKD